jgi:carboxyl-terminal processing protease
MDDEYRKQYEGIEEKMKKIEEAARIEKANKPKTNWKASILIAVGIVALVFIASLCYLQFNDYQVLVYKTGTSNTTGTTQTEEVDSEETIRTKLNAIDSIIQGTYLFDYDKQDLIDGLYKGYVSGLGDVYSTYYTAEEYEALKESTTGKYYGLGVKIQKETEDSPVLINSVFEDSPAKTAGIESGDQILKVEDQETSSMTLEEVVSAIRSTEEGKEVKLTVYKAESKETVEVTVTLADVSVDTVVYKMLDNQIGYVQLVQFEEVSSEQFKKAVEDLKSQGMQSMIIDLRDNPGGMLSVVVDIADYLLPEGLIVYTEDKNGNRQEYTSDGDSEFTMPLVVLINGNSASASEILAGAIKDYGTGTLIGTNTYGKGIVQNVLDLGDGSALKLTISNYYTPKGNYIHKVGIAPDIEVEQNADTEADEQLDVAIKQLTK